jgi:hypothetical protein
MGCKTCKDKKRVNQKNVDYENIGGPDVVIENDDTINLIPEAFQNGEFSGNFMFKVIAFIVMLIAIPLIVIVLIGKMFLTFFMPKSLPKASKRVTGFFMGVLNRYARFRHDKEVRKRKRQFEKTVDYGEVSDTTEDTADDTDEDYSDISVHENNNEKE